MRSDFINVFNVLLCVKFRAKQKENAKMYFILKKGFFDVLYNGRDKHETPGK